MSLLHYLEQGVSNTELAKRFGISRRTVYHWIETGQLDRDLDNQEVRYRARPPVTTRLMRSIGNAKRASKKGP